jgi:hypothetical protein
MAVNAEFTVIRDAAGRARARDVAGHDEGQDADAPRFLRV